MIFTINLIWSEQGEDWSVSLNEYGEIHITLKGESQIWTSRPESLDVRIPEGVYRALIKHKGETSAYLASLSTQKKGPE